MKLVTFREWDFAGDVHEGGPIRGNLIEVVGDDEDEIDAGFVLARYSNWGHGVFLCIEQVVVNDGFRGHGLGLMAVDALIRMHGDGCSQAILEPFPMKHRGGPKAWAVAKLQRYWGFLGFLPAKGRPDYWLDLRIPRSPIDAVLEAYRNR